MMGKRYLLIFLFLCLAGGNVQAEELAWEDCVREAKENHPDLVSAGEKLNQARVSKVITASKVLPQVSSDLNQDISKTEGQSKTDTYSYGITGKQLLFDG